MAVESGFGFTINNDAALEAGQVDLTSNIVKSTSGAEARTTLGEQLMASNPWLNNEGAIQAGEVLVPELPESDNDDDDDNEDEDIEEEKIENEVFEITWGTEVIKDPEEFEYSMNVLASNPDNVYVVNGEWARSGTLGQLAPTMCGIFGMPYQFSDIVDLNVEEGGTEYELGRKYIEKIFSLAPVLFLCPGEPKFMQDYGKNAKDSVSKALVEKLGDGELDNNGELDGGRYYTFNSNFPEFKKYANAALRTLAMLLGIQDLEAPIPGGKGAMIRLGDIDVEAFMNNSFTKLFGTQCVVPFFVDSDNSISDSFSNSTTESMISQTVNGFSQSAREVQFIMGSKDHNSIMNNIGQAITDVSENVLESLGELGDDLTGGSLISRLTNELTTVVSGGKIIFPEIWSGSDYNKSYDITIKLRSPDPDPVSIFLNIYMPMVLLISMAAPRQIGNSSNSYMSPFLVRATYKSIFSCDLGMIGSLDINRGGEGCWNVLGMPTKADITISLKDMYNSMFISKRMGMVANTAQMDFLATLAGIDLNEFEPTRIVKYYLMQLGNTPRDWASDMWGGFKNSLNRGAASVLRHVIGSDTRFLV